MQSYKQFTAWITDDNGKVTDMLDLAGEVRIQDQDTDSVIYLSVTDIKRLMECIERHEKYLKKDIDAGNGS